MSKLQEIQDILAQKMGWESWDEMYHANPSGLPIEEVALLFAKSVAEDALKRAAENAKILVSNGETHLDVKSYTLDDGIRFSPDYNRILSTPINTDL